MYNFMNISVIEGKTLKNVDVNREYSEIVFETEDGKTYKMYHQQECCEGVTIEDISGDIEDLIGSPILVAEKRSSEDNGVDTYGIGLWTYYTLRTNKGTVDIRWYGTSNGYYSVSVDFEQIN